MSQSASSKSGLLRDSLACVALYYPLAWISNSLLWSLPSLARVIGGARVADLRIWPVGVNLSIAGGAAGHPLLGEDSNLAVVRILVIVAVAAAILAVTHRRRPLWSGLALAVLANAALSPWSWHIFAEHHASPAIVLGAVALFVVLLLGLRWMLASQGALRGYFLRMGFLLATFGLLPALLVVALVLFRTFFFRRYGLYLIVPGTVAALLASLRPSRSIGSEARTATWWPAGVGAVLSLALGLGSPVAGREVSRLEARQRIARSRAALASIPLVSPDAPYPKLFFQKGVNFTAEWPNPYASLGAQQMLAELPAYGVNAIALVPYGWYSGQSPPRVHIQEGDEGWESDEGLAEMTRLAHHLQMKVVLKPAIWDAFTQDYQSPQDRALWFAQYQLFLDHYAHLARQIHADLFVVGGEFTHLTPYQTDWRRLIARVRELYPGPITYAANFGGEFENLGFWDALDYIGLQEYYPLPDSLDTGAVVAKVQAIQQKYHKPVIFTEAGFPSLNGANRTPWDDSTHQPLSPELQERCYEAIFRAFYDKPWFEGMYWWKIETNGSGGLQDNSHDPWQKPAIEILKRWYKTKGEG